MKVLLLQPPYTIFKTESRKCHPPLGLAYLAAGLKANRKIEILDALAEGYNNTEYVENGYLRYGLSFGEIKRRIARYAPDVVGISDLFSAQHDNVRKTCEAVKQINKDIITILGGAHVSAVPQEVLNDKNIDFVIIGEGEITLKRLLERIESKRDIEDIEGIGFRNDDHIKINKKENYEMDLDKIDFPCWDIFPLDKYFEINNPHGTPAKRRPFLPVITSRGCPFECVFCSINNLWGRIYRKRSPENVLSELLYLKNKFGVNEILFEDDNLTLDYARAEQIFQGMIDRCLEMIWSTPNGIAAQTLDDQLLELMKKSGCYSISIGVESGDEHILKDIVKKPIMLEKIKSVVKKAKRLGLKISLFFVVGLPGETHRHVRNTFKLAEGLRADSVNFFFGCPLPGTRLLELCRAEGLIKGSLEYDRLKSEQPYFATAYLSIEKLINIVNLERLKLHIIYLLTNPVGFLYKLWVKLIYEPTYFARFCKRTIKRGKI